MSVLLGAVAIAAAVTTETDAALARAAERAREATALLPDAPPTQWRGVASATYGQQLELLRQQAAAIAPLVEDARRLVLTTGGGGILG